MEKWKISIQTGLNEVEEKLRAEGYSVFEYGKAGLDADITIITGIDHEYGEIEFEQIRKNGKKEMLILDATNVSVDIVIKSVHKFTRLKNIIY